MDKFRRILTRNNHRYVFKIAYELSNQALQGQDDIIIELRDKKRTDAQNDKLHAMLTDISKQAQFNGKKRDIRQWKMIFVSGHAIATGTQAEMAIGLEGEVINLRESTAEMGVGRLSSLIEYIYAYGSSNGVKWQEFK